MFSAYAENHGTGETMDITQEIRRSAAQRLRELFPRAVSWEESAGPKIKGQKTDLLVKFKLGGEEQTLLLEVTSVGQPKQIREAITRLGELGTEMKGAYPGQLWRLDGLAKASQVSLGHAHNVIKRLSELAWVERGEQQCIQLSKPADLLDAWVDAYTYRLNGTVTYFSPERITRKLVGDLARAAQEADRRFAFTLHAGAALVAPNVRFPAIHCYLEGDPEPIAKGLGLRPGEDEGNVHLMTPYDSGVFHAPITKSGVPVVCLPQLYVDLYHYERRGREQAAHIRRETMGF